MGKSDPLERYYEKGLQGLESWVPTNPRPLKPDAQVIDFFSGCGGMSLGFAALGTTLGAFRLVGAVDVDEKSLQTYNTNFGVPAIQQDIRELASSRKATENLLKKFPTYNPNFPTVLIGCAPCQGFTAHRKKNWGEDDDRNDLIAAFTKVILQLNPDCVVMENVPELLSHRYWNHFSKFKRNLEKSGYIVKQKIINAAAHGVAQERFRAIVIAMKVDFDLPQDRFRPNEFYSVRDAISDLPVVEAGAISRFDPMHKSAKHRPETIEIIRAVPKNGGSRPAGIGPKCLRNFKGYADVYGRLKWDSPAITITHYARNPASGRFIHPQQNRGLTMREAARLQSFPDGFKFEGAFDDVFRQIGEAVPPLLSLAVACSVLTALRKESTGIGDPEIIDTPVNNSFSGVIAGMKVGRR